MKKVYIGMAADKIHAGHIEVLTKGKELGYVIVGLLTDEAIASYKRLPLTNYAERKRVVESISLVDEVVPQHTLSYKTNLKKYKPDYVVHGDDWKTGIQKNIREEVVKTIKEWHGKVIDIPRIDTPSTTDIIEYEHKFGVTPNYRRSKLKRLLEYKPYIRAIESHNGLSAIIASEAKYGGKEFDALWISSLTDSTSKGKPDIEIVDFTSRLNTINSIIDVSNKPIIVDGDTGGSIEQFIHMVRTLERLGVSAIIIEDKKYPKINSLKENASHNLEEKEKFVEKIRAGLNSKVTKDFMVIARIESLIAGKSVEHALDRAEAYISAGVDGIMIHSKNKTPTKLIEFCKEYQRFNYRVPLVVVPTTYNHIKENELHQLGANIIIYANHLLRSSHKNMVKVCNNILENECSFNCQHLCSDVKELLELTEDKI